MLLPIIVTAAVAVIVTGLLGLALIPWLRKLKFGQTILDIGPIWHKKDKQGTPTMGGMMFIIGTIVAAAAGMFLLSMNGEVSLDALGQKDTAGLISAIAAASSPPCWLRLAMTSSCFPASIPKSSASLTQKSNTFRLKHNCTSNRKCLKK